MKYVFVDFEMNPIEKKYNDVCKQCAREIVEVVDAKHLVSLENALNSCGILFSGEKHDTRNTSLFYIESKLNDISKCIENIKKYMVNESQETTSTLGELFDFGALNLQFT